MFAAFANELFAVLQRMDRDATSMIGGRPCGLQAYQHSTVANNRYEEACFRGIADRIAGCAVEVRYPESRDRCDMVISMPDGGRFWLEAKGAWKHYLWDGKVIANPSFQKHLHDRAGHDVEKLASLRIDTARYVGALLLGFDILSDPMTDDIAVFEQETGLKQSPWQQYESHWPDPHVAGHQAHAWLWVRPVPDSIK